MQTMMAFYVQGEGGKWSTYHLRNDFDSSTIPLEADPAARFFKNSSSGSR